MRYDPDRHHRRSIRLKDYDYTQNGAYFITVCTYQRECLLANIDAEGQLVLTSCGEIVLEELQRTPTIRSYVELDAFVIMPNHFHAIVIITAETIRHIALESSHAPKGPKPQSLGAIIGAFKSVASKRINLLHGTPGAPFWQRDYYDVIIRNEAMLDSRSEYIINNPARWLSDENNPVNVG